MPARAIDSDSGRLQQAIELHKTGALKKSRQSFTTLISRFRAAHDNANLARALVESSEVSIDLGEYGRAQSEALEALRLYQPLGNDGGQAQAWNVMGLSDFYRGNYGAAIRNYLQALLRDRRSRNSEAEVIHLYNLGNVYYFQGNYMAAFREYNAALATVNAHAAEKWSARRRQIVITNIATLYQRLGNYPRALDLYLELRSSPQLLVESEQARLLANLGSLYRRLGDPYKALAAYREAQHLFEGSHHSDGEIRVLRNIGIVQALDLGRLPAALESFRAAMTLAENSFSAQTMQTRLYIAETLRLMGKTLRARAEFEATLAGARRTGSQEYEWQALYGLGRIEQESGYAVAALNHYRKAIARIESVRSGLQLLPLKRDFLADKRDVYDAAIELTIASPAPSLEDVFQLIEHSRARALQDRLPHAALSAIQSRLDGSTVLLDFWIGGRNGAVLYVTRGAAGITPIPLVDVQTLRQRLTTDSTRDWRSLSHDLGASLLSRIPALADTGVQTVVIVPDGALRLLPFEILEIPSPSGRVTSLLLERARVFYTSAAAALVRTPRARLAGMQPPWRRELLAFADPVVGRDANAAAVPGGEQWEPLPSSVDEAQSAGRLVKGRSQFHVGSDALKRYLTESDAKKTPILHLGTHASADFADPERSRILFAPPSPGAPYDYLFLREVYDLDLQGVDLVVLSACDTETGKLIPGEGVEGFGGAFLAAGARSTVTTLWRVEDRATAEFMKQFYYRLARGESKAEALRGAKLKFFHSGTYLSHPRYWAAFVLDGDGLAPLPAFLSWPVAIMPALLLLGAGALFTRRLVRRRNAGRSVTLAEERPTGLRL